MSLTLTIVCILYTLHTPHSPHILYDLGIHDRYRIPIRQHKNTADTTALGGRDIGTSNSKQE